MPYTYWVRYHANGWTAWVDAAEDEGFHFGAHESSETVSWTQSADDLATAMTSADDLVPDHNCIRCPAWIGSATFPGSETGNIN
jgi:hypothetical protein